MKKLIIPVILLVTLASCKKNYDCTCNTTYLFTNSFGTSSQAFFVSKTTSMNAKMTQKQAQSVCDHEADNINATWVNFYTQNGTVSANGDSFVTRCALK